MVLTDLIKDLQDLEKKVGPSAEVHIAAAPYDHQEILSIYPGENNSVLWIDVGPGD
jgi:hypothetical protein